MLCHLTCFGEGSSTSQLSVLTSSSLCWGWCWGPYDCVWRCQTDWPLGGMCCCPSMHTGERHRVTKEQWRKSWGTIDDDRVTCWKVEELLFILIRAVCILVGVTVSVPGVRALSWVGGGGGGLEGSRVGSASRSVSSGRRTLLGLSSNRQLSMSTLWYFTAADRSNNL